MKTSNILIMFIATLCCLLIVFTAMVLDKYTTVNIPSSVIIISWSVIGIAVFVFGFNWLSEKYLNKREIDEKVDKKAKERNLSDDQFSHIVYRTLRTILQRLIIRWDKTFNRHDGLVMFGMAIGKFRVKYPDGECTAWMPYNQARDMAGIYNGVVQHKLEVEEEER